MDIDSTSDPTHGQQQLSFFNGHYDTYMYHPLLIFEGGSGILLASALRPGDVGGIRQLLPRLRPLVTQLRRRWPKRPIALRADGEFAKPVLLDYAEYAGCLYAIGLPRNPILEARAHRLCQRARQQWQESGRRVRLYTDFFIRPAAGLTRAGSRPCEVTALGTNVRFVVTNRVGTAEQIFAWYNQRGQAENYIKELKTTWRLTACPAPPTGPMPFASNSTRWPTTCWCFFAACCCTAPNWLVPPWHQVRLRPVQARRPGAPLGPPPVVPSRQRLAWTPVVCGLARTSGHHPRADLKP